MKKVYFWVTMVYGFNKLQERESLWEKHRSYALQCDGSWAVCGDFNSIVVMDERIGGTGVTWAEMAPMRNMMSDCLFDHCPCIITMVDTYVRKKPSFKYYNMWSLALNYLTVVQSGWHVEVQGTPMFRIVEKLKGLKQKLKELDREQFSDIENLTHVAELSLKYLQEQVMSNPLNPDFCNAEKECAQELIQLKKARDSFLAQKAKEDWAKNGDDNTSFFHAIVTDDEIKQAMFSIPGTKAPGPDGYSSQFFKDSWAIVGKDICASVRNMISTGNILKEANNTILTLLPKVDVPDTVTQFRPIACCNTVYKCMAKVVCSRLSSILPDIIHPSQSAFIAGRDIVGNILICQDLIKLYKRKKCSPRLMMKIDFQKAYDSIEWSYLNEMLRYLKFPDITIKLLMQCVSSPSYSLSLNGEVFGFFKGKRGLRLGDPLSPLLFTICLEYLSRLLGSIPKCHGFKFHPLYARLSINHLCFADDLLMFSRGDLESVTLMLRAFSTFSLASGLQMNKDKSNFYCNGVTDSVVQAIENASEVGSFGPAKYAVDRVTERIQRLGARKLSYAGRVVLISSVLSTLNSHWARVFIIPKTVMKKIESICGAFLWYGNDSCERPNLVSWKQICQPRRKGGLGFKNLHTWNLALIAKYVWWVEKKADHLWVKWVHAIYIKDRIWKDYEPFSCSSWAWKRICQVKNRLKPLLFDVTWRDLDQDYSTQMGYSWLVYEVDDVPWFPWIQNRMLLPKHSFHVWLIAQNRLLTQDRLFRMQIIQANCCFLCGNAEESIDHLFFICPYSQKCKQLLVAWLDCFIPDQGFIQRWIEYRCRSLFMKQCIAAGIVSLMYGIWFARNRCQIEHVVPLPAVIIKQVKGSFSMQLKSRRLEHRDWRVHAWVTRLEQSFRLMNTSFYLTLDQFADHLRLTRAKKGYLRDVLTDFGASGYMPLFTGRPAPTSCAMLINDIQHVTLKIFLWAITCLLYGRKDLKLPPKRSAAYIQASEMTIDKVARMIEQQDALLEALKNVGKGAEKLVDATHLSTIIICFNPSTYEGTGEPKLLDNWHREMESLLEVVECPAELNVKEDARAYYKDEGLDDIPWAGLKSAMREQYAEDMQLGQRGLALWFEKGLDPKIMNRLPARVLSDLKEVYARAGHAERLVDLAKEANEKTT
ncbi:uncharacterized protein LOC141632394 [Silene latifolia]|uniref:uncharacterized protein LOC141632394 n=1 Tax=Silene latifolia TaxID=37657 RepID=UPI003D77634A